MCSPSSPETATPPSAAKTFSSELLETSSTAMMDSLEKAIEDIFVDRSSAAGAHLHNTSFWGNFAHLHNTSFWGNFLHTLQFELSGGLMVHSQPRSKAEVCYQLLNPLLRRVAHSAAQIPVPEGSGIEQIVYTTSLNYEVQTEERGSQRRRQPQVDFALSAHVENDVLYCVPVESKKKVETKDMVQLSDYQAALGA